MGRYMALERVALSTGLVEKGAQFESDAVPGRAWKPIDKDAKAAVKARDAAAREVAAPSVDPRVAELEAALAEACGEINRLQSEVEALTAPPADEPPAAE